MTKLDKIFCPTCNKEKTWHANNPYRPFCSERCKLIDLGDWASEKHKVAAEDVPPDELLSDNKK